MTRTYSFVPHLRERHVYIATLRASRGHPCLREFGEAKFHGLSSNEACCHCGGGRLRRPYRIRIQSPWFPFSFPLSLYNLTIAPYYTIVVLLHTRVQGGGLSCALACLRPIKGSLENIFHPMLGLELEVQSNWFHVGQHFGKYKTTGLQT